MKALHGVRVLDLSRLLPGPFASLVLADLGAEVDKIEDTDAGDYLRHMPPTLAPRGADQANAGDTSAMFLALNRSKRSACLDLEEARGARRVPHARREIRRRPRAVSAQGSRSPRPLARDAPRAKPAARDLRAHRLRPERPARDARRPRHRLPRARGDPRVSRPRGRAAAAAGLSARRRERRALGGHRNHGGARRAHAYRQRQGRRRVHDRGGDALRHRVDSRRCSRARSSNAAPSR